MNTRLDYPITLTPDTNGTLLVGFPDVPIANSVGDDRADALANAIDALESAFEIYINEGKPMPLPSSDLGDAYVSVPAELADKILSWNERFEPVPVSAQVRE